jgi:chorismate mutase
MLDSAEKAAKGSAHDRRQNPRTDCETMTEVRAGVDQVDRELVALLVRRFGYMDAAARIKSDRGTVRDEARKAEVLDNVAREAEAAGLVNPSDFAPCGTNWSSNRSTMRRSSGTDCAPTADRLF